MSRRNSLPRLVIVVDANNSDNDQSSEHDRPYEPDGDNMPAFLDDDSFEETTSSPRQPPKPKHNWRSHHVKELHDLAHRVINTNNMCKGLYGVKFAEEILLLTSASFRRAHGTASAIKTALNRRKRTPEGRRLEAAYDAKFPRDPHTD